LTKTSETHTEVSVERKPKNFPKFRAKINYCVLPSYYHQVAFQIFPRFFLIIPVFTDSFSLFSISNIFKIFKFNTGSTIFYETQMIKQYPSYQIRPCGRSKPEINTVFLVPQKQFPIKLNFKGRYRAKWWWFSPNKHFRFEYGFT
jgi:hypothetical protein